MELFTKTEVYPSPEQLTSPEEYVADLRAHTQTIPNPSDMPTYSTPSREDQELLSKYCLGYEAETPITPLQRDDIIEPAFCQRIDSLLIKLTNLPYNRTWYKRAGEETSPYSDPRTEYASREWDQFFVGYVRERREFHVAFMEATLYGRSIDEEVAAIGLENGAPIQVPNFHPDNYSARGPEAPPDFMYNRASWLSASLLSALALPPEHCNPSMKCRAIELWAAHVDPNNANPFEGLHKFKNVPAVNRLPWSMRTSQDMRQNVHERWRLNPTIKEYFGEPHSPRADGFEALLQDRPKDYVQAILLHLGGYGRNGAIRELHRLANFPAEVKNIIFSEDAAHNTVFGEPAFDAYDEPKDLDTLLSEAQESAPATEEDDPEVKLAFMQELISGQKLRLHMLKEELAETKQGQQTAESSALEWQAHYNDLSAQYDEVVRRHNVLAERLTAAGVDFDPLFAAYGIAPNTPDELVEAMVAGLRRYYNKHLHSDKGSSEEAEEALKVANNDLDNILRTRELGKFARDKK
jgi:hypothetical protein